MIRCVFAVPGDLDAPTGGYAYARRLLALLPAQGIAVEPLMLPGSYPDPTPADLALTAQRLAAVPPGVVVLADGLALGAMDAATLDALRSPVVALVHHPLGYESGLPPPRREALLASERRALARAGRVVATSPATARLLSAVFALPTERIAIAEPGTEPAPRAGGTGTPVDLLAVGAVSPRKGYDLLAAALADLRDLDWRATIVGSLVRDPVAVSDLRRAIAAARLDGRIVLAGAVAPDRLEELFARADLFVSPSLFEGYGMGLCEALARGLPIVASTGGAAAETVPDGAALKVPPGDVDALAAALGLAMTDAGLRRRLADASWIAGRALPRWQDTAAKVARALREAAA